MNDQYDLYETLHLERSATTTDLHEELSNRVSTLAQAGKGMSDPEYHETATALRILGEAAPRKCYDARLATAEPISVDDLLILADTGRLPQPVTPAPVKVTLMVAAVLTLIGIIGAVYFGYLTFYLRLHFAAEFTAITGLNYALFSQLVLLFAGLGAVEAFIAYGVLRRRLWWPPTLVTSVVLFFCFLPSAGFSTYPLMIGSFVLVLLAAQLMLLAWPKVRFWVAA